MTVAVWVFELLSSWERNPLARLVTLRGASPPGDPANEPVQPVVVSVPQLLFRSPVFDQFSAVIGTGPETHSSDAAKAGTALATAIAGRDQAAA